MLNQNMKGGVSKKIQKNKIENLPRKLFIYNLKINTFF